MARARPRALRDPIERVEVAADGRDEVRRAHAHRGVVRLAIADRDEAAVVRHVEPLVAVERPRVGRLEPVDEVSVARRCGGPHAERAVDVDPRSDAVCRLDDLHEADRRHRCSRCRPAPARWPVRPCRAASWRRHRRSSLPARRRARARAPPSRCPGRRPAAPGAPTHGPRRRRGRGWAAHRSAHAPRRPNRPVRARRVEPPPVRRRSRRSLRS